MKSKLCSSFFFALALTAGAGELLSNGGFETPCNPMRGSWQLPDGHWYGGTWVHMAQADGDYRIFLKKVEPLASRRVSTVSSFEGKNCLKITTPPAVMEMKNNKGRSIMVSNTLRQNFKAAAATPLKCRFSAMLRGKLEKNGNFVVMLYFFDAKNKRIGTVFSQDRTRFTVPSQWTRVEMPFVIPAGTAKMTAAIGIYGSGTVELDNVSIVQESVLSALPQKKIIEQRDVRSFQGTEFDRGGVSLDLAKCNYSAAVGKCENSISKEGKEFSGLSVRIFPNAFTDNVYCVAENHAGHPLFAIRNAKNIRHGQVVLSITAPRELKISSENQSYFKELSRTRGADGRETLRLSIRKNWTFPRNFSGYRSVWVNIKSLVKAGKKLYPLEYHLEYDGAKSKTFRTFVKVIPPISGVRPKEFYSGVDGWLHMFDQVTAEDYVNFYAECGFSAFCVNCIDTVPIAKELKKHKITRWFGNDRFANGYTMGIGPKPEDKLFRGIDGKPVELTQLRPLYPPICPGEVARNTDYFRKHVLNYIEEMFFKKDLAEHLLPNWEPYPYNGKGCFCNNCKKDFIAWSKLPKAEVEKYWPRKIQEKYGKRWTDFRSFQHGEGLKNIQKGMTAIARRYGRKDCWIIPAISAASVFLPDLGVFAEYKPQDYLSELPWVDPWGPYIYHSFMEGYQEKIGVHATMKVVAERLRAYFEEMRRKTGKAPKLLALPHCDQCGSWETEPEALAFETLIFFVENWHASAAYRIMGTDARYYRSLANANTAIAAVEKEVMHGKFAPEITVEPMHKLNIVPAVCQASRLAPNEPFKSAIEKTPLLYCRGFAGKDFRLAAAGNFYERSLLYGKVRFPGLKPGAYQVTLPVTQRILGSPSGKALWNEKELASGVLIPVGALRWEFVKVTPASSKQKGAVIPAAEICRQFKKDTQGIENCLNFDRSAAKSEQVTYDFGALPGVETGSVSATPRDGMNSSVITVKTPEYQVELNMKDGGVLKNWKSGKKRFLPEKGWIGRDALYLPANSEVAVNSPYRFCSWDNRNGAVEVILSLPQYPKKYRALTGLEVTKRYLFHKSKIELEVTIANPTGTPRTLGFRQHSWINAEILAASGCRHVYGQTPRLLNLEGTPAAPAFGLDCTGTFRKGVFSFSGKEGNFRCTFPGAAFPVRLMLWSNPSPTFEPFFPPVTLKSGEKFTWVSRWEMEK